MSAHGRSLGLGEGLEEDEEVDEDEEEEGEEEGHEHEHTPIMDSTVSTAMAATLALQARRSVGRPLRWMEHIKMERLKQVNGGALPRSGPLSPTPPPKGSTLPTILGKGKALLSILHYTLPKDSSDLSQGLLTNSVYSKCYSFMSHSFLLTPWAASDSLTVIGCCCKMN